MSFHFFFNSGYSDSSPKSQSRFRAEDVAAVSRLMDWSGCPLRHLKRVCGLPLLQTIRNQNGLGVHCGTCNRACGLPLLQTYRDWLWSPEWSLIPSGPLLSELV